MCPVLTWLARRAEILWVCRAGAMRIVASQIVVLSFCLIFLLSLVTLHISLLIRRHLIIILIQYILGILSGNFQVRPGTVRNFSRHA